jgi:hypothetical protein
VPWLPAAGFIAALALASAAGRTVLAAAVVVVQFVFALGGVRRATVPAARPAGWLALTVGVTGSVWTAFADTADLKPAASLLGPALVVAVVVQLARRAGREYLTESLTLAVGASALAVLPVAWIALRGADGGAYAVGLGLLGVGVVAVAEAIPLSPAARRMLAVLAAAGLAAGFVSLIDDVAAAVPAVGAVVVTAFGALTAMSALAAVDRLGGEIGDRDGAMLVPMYVALPIVAAAPVVYVLGRILVG